MEYSFKFTEQELQVVLQGLGEIPAKFSIPVVDSIRNQISKTQEKQVEEPSESIN